MLRDKIHETAFQLLGPPTTPSTGFYENDEEIKAMLAEKKLFHRIYQLDQSSDSFHQHSQDSRPTNQTTQDARLVAHYQGR